jgi:L-fuconolactonase
MAKQSPAEVGLIDRRTVLGTGAALAAAWPALLRGAPGEAQPRPRAMTVIDSQVHAYEANTPKRPWFRAPNWPAHVTGDEMVAAMDKVGVDGAIFISPFSLYQYDGSYAVEVQRAHPNRFALVKPVNPDDPAVADVIADWKKTPGTVGIRIIFTKEANRAPDDPGFERILRAAVKHDFPVNVLFWGNVDAGTALVDRYPDTRFIITI